MNARCQANGEDEFFDPSGSDEASAHHLRRGILFHQLSEAVKATSISGLASS
jgi:hypothetical protein